jgi:hypothetical protein
MSAQRTLEATPGKILQRIIAVIPPKGRHPKVPAFAEFQFLALVPSSHLSDFLF